MFLSFLFLYNIGFIVADRGYDVWIGNARGTQFSRQHLVHNFNKSETYWNFSWHEIGIYDLPAIIDYILLLTNQSALHYVGHSQGTTALFVLCAMRPEYNQKIITAHLMTPVAYFNNLSFFTSLLGANVNELEVGFELIVKYNGLSISDESRIRVLCRQFFSYII